MSKKSQKQINTDSQAMRLDKWLWCARFYKSRSLAGDAIKAGKVKLNGITCKPGKDISIGDLLSIRRGNITMDIEVLRLARSRLSAKSAADLFLETETSIQNREKVQADIKNANQAVRYDKKKPNKKERRKLLKFTGKRF